MLFPFSKTLSLSEERGAIMPFLAVVLIVGFMFAALGIDLGDITRRRGLLHSSLDAASLRGATILKNGGSRADAEQVAHGFAEANLRAKGLETPAVQNALNLLAFSYPQGDIISAGAKIEHDNVFAHFLKNQEDYLHAPAVSDAIYERGSVVQGRDCIYISLLIDTSGSISSQNASGVSRMDSIIRAVNALVAKLPDNFAFNITYFSDTTTRATDNLPPGSPLNPGRPLVLGDYNNRTLIDNFLQSMPSYIGTSTNTAAGLQRVLMNGDGMCYGVGGTKFRLTVLITDSMPDTDIFDLPVLPNYTNAGNDQYNCSTSQIGDPDYDEGNAIAWAQLSRTSPIPSTVFVFNIGGADPDFLKAIAGLQDYDELACPRTVTQSTPPGEYHAVWDDQEFADLITDAVAGYQRSVGYLDQVRLVR